MLLIEATGRVPNLGPNNGAHLLDLTDLGYLDYRPTVQALGMIREGRRWLLAGRWDNKVRGDFREAVLRWCLSPELL